VGSSGLEPPTSRLSGARSNRLSYEPIFLPVWDVVLEFGQVLVFTCPHGGDEQIRTVDPLLARQVLSQLSYTPMFRLGSCPHLPRSHKFPCSLKIKQRKAL
jgi:hypothetical protein